MSRLPLVDPDADRHARALLQHVREVRGRVFNVYRALGNHPEVLEGVLAFGKAAYFQNSLTPAQRELAYLGASWPTTVTIESPRMWWPVGPRG